MKTEKNFIESTVTYTVEITEHLGLEEDYTKEQVAEGIKEAIESMFCTADVHVKNLKVFEGTEGGHE